VRMSIHIQPGSHSVVTKLGGAGFLLCAQAEARGVSVRTALGKGLG
jgi:hypothetical protein